MLGRKIALLQPYTKICLHWRRSSDFVIFLETLLVYFTLFKNCNLAELELGGLEVVAAAAAAAAANSAWLTGPAETIPYLAGQANS